MAAYCRVYDSRHLQADCKKRDQLRDPTLGYRVWTTFSFFSNSTRCRSPAGFLRLLLFEKCFVLNSEVFVANKNINVYARVTDSTYARFYHVTR